MIRSELPEHRCDDCQRSFPRTATFKRQPFIYDGGEYDAATGLALIVRCPACQSESVIHWSADP